MASTAGDVSIARPSFWQSLTNHPAGFWFIFWGELAERCSFYGMRAILVSYMVEALQFSRKDAGTYYALFVAGCYLLPLAGGYLADNFFGKYPTIVAFSLPYILGHYVLSIETPLYLFIALVMLAMGSGVIKPNISTLMGLTYDQYRPGQDQLRSNAFSIFYMAINIGAAISQIAVPYLRTEYSYQYAFLFPAFLMAIAFVIFAIGKPFYAREVIQRTTRTPEEKALQWQVVLRIGFLFLMVMFFWAIFDQSGSSWILFAKDYMNLDLFVLGYQVDAEMMQAINPFLIVLLVPVTTLLWTTLNARGIHVRATTKIMLGFLLTAGCMGVMAYTGYAVGATGADGVVPPEARVSIKWQALAYLFITVAEILISITGLELAFVAAPKSMKGFVTSLWLLTVFLANLLLNTPLAQVYPEMHPGNYFAMLAGLMLGVCVVFVFVARQFNRTPALDDTTFAATAPVQPAPGSDGGIRPGYPAAGPSSGIQAGLPPE